MARFGRYLDSWKIKEKVVEKVDDNMRNALYSLCINTITNFHKTLEEKEEGVHPFALYKFLQFVKRWEEEINAAYKAAIASKIEVKQLDEVKSLFEKIPPKDSKTGKRAIFNYFFKNNIYFLAKYELYRQMGLKLSGDMALYDVKRLIYSLLVVYQDDKFSNDLVTHVTQKQFDAQP